MSDDAESALLRYVARDINHLLKTSGRWANCDATWGRTTADAERYLLLINDPHARMAWLVPVPTSDVLAYIDSPNARANIVSRVRRELERED